MMSEFTRNFNKIEELREERLFKEKLLPDIKKGDVFPAIRNGYVSFYYKSGGIFEYRPQKKFTTHHNYVRAEKKILFAIYLKQKSVVIFLFLMNTKI